MKKKISINKIIFWLILLAGALLRIYKLGQIPSILNRDEAALAYNAYLLMETGMDEWQRSWPLTLESFGDYKLPGYPLLIIPFFKIFGLHDWVVRLPATLAGIALLPLSYLLAKKFNLKNKLFGKEQMALFVMFLLAFSPVTIFYSRMGYEANVGLTYFISILLLLFSIKEKPNIFKNLGLFILLLLGIFTYNTPFLLLPFLIIFLLISYPLNKPKTWLPSLIILLGIFFIGLMVLLPLTAQKSGITIFTDETVWANWIAFRNSLPTFFAKTLGNKYIYYLMLVIKNFFTSFSPMFLVVRGGSHEWHSLPTMGHIFGSTYILSLIGIVTSIFKILKNLFKKKLSKIMQSSDFLLLFLLVISLAPAAITVDAPHATRSLLFFVLLAIFATIGLSQLISLIKTKKYRQMLFNFTIVIILLESIFHIYHYFNIYPTKQHMFLPGFKEIIQQVREDHGNEKNIAIVDPDGYQYILTAWYLKLSPDEYFATINRQDPDKIGFRYGDYLSNFHFIANKLDRTEEEEVMVFWDKQVNQWFVKIYKNL